MALRIILALFVLAASARAMAQQSAQVPEGSQLTLFALGLLGVIVGRRAAMRRQQDDD